VGELEYAPLEQRLLAVREGVKILLQTRNAGVSCAKDCVFHYRTAQCRQSSLLNALLRAERAIVTR